MDSVGFTELSTHDDGGLRRSRWKTNGNLVAAVTQDLMCEPSILEETGLTIEDHQQNYR
jgi:hypothetical protein